MMLIEKIDWDRLVTVDFETFYGAGYSLTSLSTSEYVRDPRFKAQMVGVKIGRKPTKVYGPKQLAAALKKINWATHSLLCHNTQFDGFVLSHHYGIVPARYYDTLSMARGLHSNEIGSGLDEVARFYGGRGKIDGVLDKTKDVLDWPKPLFDEAAVYCAQDVDETVRIFEKMVVKMPVNEMDLIHMTIRMFCDPVLKVDLPRVEKELKRELDRRQELFYQTVEPARYDIDGDLHDPAYFKTRILKTGKERALTGVERDMLIVRRVIGNDEVFADLLRDEGATPPVKVSPAWMARSAEEQAQTIDEKWAYAFSKTDMAFVDIPNDVDSWAGELSREKASDIAKIVVKQQRLQALVDCRLAVKSTTNITRAQRFLTAGANGMSLPCGYAYARAHTLRWGGNNKMNMQNLTRGGELRLSILAPKGHQLCVVDSGQIEARVNGWLWDQDDLMAAFRAADTGTGTDAYCRFATMIYGRPITKDDETERFVGKVCVLGLGYQMGAPKFQMTLARGALGGPPIHFELDRCYEIVNTYRRANHKIQAGWSICERIIEDMAAGRTGSHKCITWEKGQINLPNGLAMKYPDLRKAKGSKGWDEWTYQAGRFRSKIYGGLLCENLVQCLARIIVAEQMLMIDKKYRVVMTTHDEAVTCVKTAVAKTALKFMLKCMSTPLSWCLDIPLNCEGKFDVNYSK
ncbi:MAG: hypothetical protein KGL39_57385 [Patescibacteria group bacterium]|nr:hypothetical protein [Patescibacteria group bacterium]